MIPDFIHKFFAPFASKQIERDSEMEVLIAQIYMRMGMAVCSGYTLDEVREACLTLASSQPVPMQQTLLALYAGDPVLSRDFLEELVAFGQKNEKKSDDPFIEYVRKKRARGY